MHNNAIYLLFLAGEHCAFLHIFFTSPWPDAMAWRSKYFSLFFSFILPFIFLFPISEWHSAIFAIRQLSLGLFIQRICWEINHKDYQLMLSELVQARQIRADQSLEVWIRSKLICIQWAPILIQSHFHC